MYVQKHATKIALIDELSQIGVTEIEVSAFISPAKQIDEQPNDL